MAKGYSTGGFIARIVILILLILMAIGGGLFLFDRLGLLQLDSRMLAITQFIGVGNRGSSNAIDTIALVEKDRMDKEAETLSSRELSLNQLQDSLNQKEQELQQKADMLQEQERLLAEKEQNLNQALRAYDDREANLLQQAGYLSNMPPQEAISILLGMNDQDLIDVLRATERFASQNNTASLVSVWLQMIAALPDRVVNGVIVTPTNAERVATIMRKMTMKSASLGDIQ